MSQVNVRWAWLKGMYIYNILGAGAFGLGILFAPEFMMSTFGWPPQERIISFGVTGSVYVSLALLSILGLRSPLKYSPLLLYSLCYKSVWFIAVILPVVVNGTFPAYAILPAAIYATYILGDMIAIPFAYVFSCDTTPDTQQQSTVGGAKCRN